MAVSVNPPPQIRIPKKFREDRELRVFFEQYQTLLFQLWTRTGGGSDLIDENSQEIREFNDLSEFDFLQEADSDVEITAVDYETITNQIIICTAGLTVSLNPEPQDQEKVAVHMPVGSVTIDGSGKLVNGRQSILFKRKYTTIDVIYVLELDEWIII